MLALQSLRHGLTCRLGAGTVNHRREGFGRVQERRIAPLAASRGAADVNQEWGMRRLTSILRCEKGANAIEYALVATLIAIAAIGAFHNLGNKIDAMYNNVGNAM